MDAGAILNTGKDTIKLSKVYAKDFVKMFGYIHRSKTHYCISLVDRSVKMSHYFTLFHGKIESASAKASNKARSCQPETQVPGTETINKLVLTKMKSSPKCVSVII